MTDREKNICVNHLPSLTWNRIKVNCSEVAVRTGFEKTDTDFGNCLPSGVRFYKDVCESPYINILDNLKNTNPREKYQAGKNGIYTVEGLQSALGSEAGMILDDEKIRKNLIVIEKGTVADAPVTARYELKDGKNIASRQIIYAKKGSSVNVVISYDSDDSYEAGGQFMLETQVICEEGASVRLAKAQITGDNYRVFDDTAVFLSENACFEFTQTETGGKEIYTGCYVNQYGDGSSFEGNIAYMLNDDDRLDMNYVALQRGKKTKSSIKVKGVLNDDSLKIFRGTIDFRNGSSGSVGDEQEDVVLMSDTCDNKTIPLILCEEEDVEGRHGATIGRLNDDMLFYLGTRGIDERSAMKIITKARLRSVYHGVDDENAKEKIRKKIEAEF